MKRKIKIETVSKVLENRGHSLIEKWSSESTFIPFPGIIEELQKYFCCFLKRQLVKYPHDAGWFTAKAKFKQNCRKSFSFNSIIIRLQKNFSPSICVFTFERERILKFYFWIKTQLEGIFICLRALGSNRKYFISNLKMSTIFNRREDFIKLKFYASIKTGH